MIRWGSLLTTPDGEVDPTKLKVLASVTLALVGGAALIAGTLYQALRNGQAETSGLIWMAGICVAPLTGGAIGAGFGAAQGKLASQAIVAGAAPGRRASDTQEAPKP